MKYDCIVLDLDGTLVSSSRKNKGNGSKMHFKDMYGNAAYLWVHKRPGFDEFLHACFEKSAVGVWSMGQPGYVDAIVSLFPETPQFVYNWCNCDREPGRIFKKLDNIPHSGSVVMIDDNISVLDESPRVKTLIVPEWSPKLKDDKILYNLISKLE